MGLPHKPRLWEGVFSCSRVYSEGLKVSKGSCPPQAGAKDGFSFPQRVVERMPSHSCAYLSVNYLWLLLDKSLRITDSERGRSISRLGRTGTGTSCQQRALALAVART